MQGPTDWTERLFAPPAVLPHRDGELRVGAALVPVEIGFIGFQLSPDDPYSGFLGVYRRLADCTGRLHEQVSFIRTPPIWTSISGKVVEPDTEIWDPIGERCLVHTRFSSDSRDDLVFLFKERSTSPGPGRCVILLDHHCAGRLEIIAVRTDPDYEVLLVRVTNHNDIELDDDTTIAGDLPLIYDLDEHLLWGNHYQAASAQQLIEEGDIGKGKTMLPFIFSATDEYREPQPGVEFVPR